MGHRSKADESQAALWNDGTGRGWIEAQGPVEELLRPLGELLTEAVAARSPCRVLDVGCGTGGTTLAAARLLGGEDAATGIDVSEPMIEVARVRAEREGVAVRFVHADAEAHAFDPGSFELLISRFGVMFFADPVAAFANLRRAAAEGAELRMIAWRGPDENPFMTAAERAAAPLLPDLPPRRTDAPGQFAFADRERVRSILAEAGWAEVDVQPIDVPCAMAEEHLIPSLSHLGPVGRAMRGADEATRARILAAVRPAFDRYVDAEVVRFTAACWMLGARAAAAGGSTRRA